MTKQNHSQPRNYYQIGLGEQMLERSRLVFLVLILVVLAAVGASGYVGVKTGDFHNLVVKPMDTFVEAFKQVNRGDSNGPSLPAVSQALPTPTPTEPEPDTNKNAANYHQKTTVEYKIVYPTINYNQNSQNWQQIKKEDDEWWAKVQAEDKQKALDSQKQYDDFKAQSQKDLQDFANQGATQVQQFKDKYGIKN